MFAFCVVVSLFFLVSTASGAILEVPQSTTEMCVSTPLPEGVALESEERFYLFELGCENPMRVPVECVPLRAEDGVVLAPAGRLVAIIPPATVQNPGQNTEQNSGQNPTPRRFRLIKDKRVTSESIFEIKNAGDATLTFCESGSNVLSYNYETITRPEIRDFRNKRAAYIHPLWGLDGEILTDDFPPDHFHHHGVFWAWMHVSREGKDHDLWMSKDISQRFERFLHRQDGGALVLGVENSWRLHSGGNAAGSAEGEVVATERVWIHAWPATQAGRMIDLDLYIVPRGKPLTLRGAEGKSYGGLTIRYRMKSGMHPAITTSLGKSTEDLPICPLEWADLSAKFGATPSGAAIFVPADHPADPEFGWPPTWLTRFYGICAVGWPGVQGMSFEPEQTIHLRYRLWVHRGAPDFATLKERYDNFRAEDEVRWVPGAPSATGEE
ncbi:MAG: PmoA family protein [Planctomycetia bacterium]|nr:PmoA family protein [Planctomycetia bacterium]